jgi:hypothetical protein
MPTYHVNVIDEYAFLKIDDNITSCRRWAARAFPGHQVHVCRSYRFCDTCQSAPCGCPRVTVRRTAVAPKLKPRAG